MTTIMDHHMSETTRQGVRVFLRMLLLIGDQPHALGDAEIACDTLAGRARLAQVSLTTLLETATSFPSALVTPELCQRLATLGARLGMAEPRDDQLGAQEAITLLTQFQGEKEELWQNVAQARSSSPSEPALPPAEKSHVRPQGSVEDLRRSWEHFKQHVWKGCFRSHHVCQRL